MKYEDNPVVLALDGMSRGKLLDLAELFRGSGCILKIGDAFARYGVELVRALTLDCTRVMVDGNWHHTPATMMNMAGHLIGFPPWAVTVDASAGAEGIAAVVNVMDGGPTKVFATLLLTSLEDSDCREIYNRRLADEVRILAMLARRCGVHGFVCAPEDASILRTMYPDSIIVTPGVRSPSAPHHDHHRISTPANALAAGANHIVMGRQILDARSPLIELRRVLEKELKLLAADAATLNQ